MLFWPTHNSQYGEIAEDEIRNPSATATRSITGRRIASMKTYFEQNVPTPTQDTHAANKAYVDEKISKNQAWSLDLSNGIRLNNHTGISREANSDGAEIAFRSNNNDDTCLDFKLLDDGSERFRFLYNNTWRTAWNWHDASFKQKLFAHAQFGEFPLISFALGDSDTGFNWNSDGNFTMKANGADLNTFHTGRAPIVWNWKNNGEIRQLTQAQYDALGAWRPENVIYYITD